MSKAIFEEIFEGPDSIFGQIFGPSREKLAEIEAAKKPRKVRIKVKPEQIDKLLAGESLKFTAKGMNGLVIEIHRR